MVLDLRIEYEEGREDDLDVLDGLDDQVDDLKATRDCVISSGIYRFVFCITLNPSKLDFAVKLRDPGRGVSRRKLAQVRTF